MITGIIEKKEITEGNKEGKAWRRYCFTIGAKKYSTFDAKIGDFFKQGDNVDIDGTQNGAYFNMKSMIMHGSTDAITKQSGNLQSCTNDSIARMCALKCAVEFAKGANLGSELVTDIADSFVNWINQSGVENGK
jgi:hypothetical protein